MAKLLTVVETPTYLSRAAKLMSEAERNAVIDMIAASPNIGVLVRGTGGLRKMRVPLEGRGKRGGGRVIYWFHSEDYPAVLLWAFAKNQAADLTSAQRARVRSVAEALVKDFGERK
jgi:hypothetical protein